MHAILNVVFPAQFPIARDIAFAVDDADERKDEALGEDPEGIIGAGGEDDEGKCGLQRGLVVMVEVVGGVEGPG